MGPYLTAAFFITRRAAPLLLYPTLTAICKSTAKVAARKTVTYLMDKALNTSFAEQRITELSSSYESLLSSGSSDSFFSMAAETDTGSDTAIDAEEDRNNILAFIADLDAANATNETAWTHDSAMAALSAKQIHDLTRSRYETRRADFDFSIHFDPILLAHLRQSYAFWDSTGDIPLAWRSQCSTTTVSSPQSLVHAIGAAMMTPARESDGQRLRKKEKERTESENRILEVFDAAFESTWRGTVAPKIASWYEAADDA